MTRRDELEQVRSKLLRAYLGASQLVAIANVNVVDAKAKHGLLDQEYNPYFPIEPVYPDEVAAALDAHNDAMFTAAEARAEYENFMASTYEFEEVA